VTCSMFQIHCHRQSKVIRHPVLEYHYFTKNVGGAEDLNCLMFTCNTCSKIGTVDIISTIPSVVWSLEELLVSYPFQNMAKLLLIISVVIFGACILTLAIKVTLSNEVKWILYKYSAPLYTFVPYLLYSQYLITLHGHCSL